MIWAYGRQRMSIRLVLILLRYLRLKREVDGTLILLDGRNGQIIRLERRTSWDGITLSVVFRLLLPPQRMAWLLFTLLRYNV